MFGLLHLSSLIKNIQKKFSSVYFLLPIILMLFITIVLRSLEIFPIIGKTIAIIRQPLTILLFGIYCTAYPTYLVILFSLFPIKYIFPLYVVGFIAVFAM